MYPEPLTPCRCELAGFCERHQCEKTYQWVLACRLNWHLFEQWENGEGPCAERIRAMLDSRAPPPEPFAELPACRHRSAEPLEFVDCELCGGRNERVPLYSCAFFGKCTSRRYGTRTEVMRTMPSCIRCEKYDAEDVTQNGATKNGATQDGATQDDATRPLPPRVAGESDSVASPAASVVPRPLPARPAGESDSRAPPDETGRLTKHADPRIPKSEIPIPK